MMRMHRPLLTMALGGLLAIGACTGAPSPASGEGPGNTGVGSPGPGVAAPVNTTIARNSVFTPIPTVPGGAVFPSPVGGEVAGISSAGSRTASLAAQNNSGLNGTATLTDLGDGRTRVEIRV